MYRFETFVYLDRLVEEMNNLKDRGCSKFFIIYREHSVMQYALVYFEPDNRI